VAWLTLGITSIALALIAAMVLRSERESTAVLHHLSLMVLNLKDVLADLANAQSEERGYLLTGQPSSLERFERSRVALSLEFDRLTALVKNNPVELQRVKRVRKLVEQDLNEFQRSIAIRAAGGSQAASAEIRIDRESELTEILRRRISEINEHDEGVLARLAQRRRVRLASALGAMSGALFLSACYVLIGLIIIARNASRHRRAEEALRAMPAGVFRCSRDLRYKWVSPSYAAWLGRLPEEIIGQPIGRVLGQEAHEAIAPHMEKVISGKREEYEDQINYPGVGARWIHAVYVPTRGHGNEVDGCIGVVADVTERREAEERLRESEERFRNMADTAPVMIWMAGPDKLCTFFNKFWLDFTGRTMEQELGNGWAKSVHPDDLDRCITTYVASFEVRRSFRMEYRLRRVDGEYRWILDDGAPRFTNAGIFAGYVGSCIDITDRRRAEEERQKFVSLADRSLEFIGMCGLDFRPFYINSAGMRLVGLDNLEAACQVRVQDYFFPEDQHFITDEFLPRVLRDGHGAVEIRVRHFKTGAAIWMLFNVFNIFDSHGALVGWATVSINITDRKKAEDALRGALQQLQLVTDNMPAAVARYSRGQRYVWVSKTYTAWLGRLPDKIVGCLIADVVGSEGYEVFRPHIEKVLSGQRDEFETRVSFLPGGTRWIHVVYVPTTGQDLKVDGWIGVLADVTERHEAEERLRKSEERFRATFFQAAVGIAQTSVEGQWRLLNDRLCEIVGYSQDELREKRLIEITHPDDCEALLAARHKLLAGEISTWSSDKRYIRKDGVTGWARVFVSLVRNQANEPQYFVTVVEDITEKILAERALQQSRQELRALAGRLINAEDEERKRISRELHDELSQKLALLAFNIGGLLMEHAPSAEKINEQLRDLQVHVKQLAQDVRQISHQLHPSILDDLGLVSALSELCEEFSAREGIEVAFESEAVPQVLPIDIASCLYRLSQEALHNVLKHAQASQARLKLNASADGIHLCIRDNGVGFDSESGLSQPGLGIVSMKERVGLVQGEFSIHSRLGEGTEVRVFVPLLRNAA
jgi:PAS domain S-box-containing protein